MSDVMTMTVTRETVIKALRAIGVRAGSRNWAEYERGKIYIQARFPGMSADEYQQAIIWISEWVGV